MSLYKDETKVTKITVFVPTFNRADYLPRLYKSLINQTYKDFTWLIVDDGSSDGTENLVKQWIADNKVHIQYHYQENKGKHFAYNRAIELTNSELFVDIDSDDYLLDHALERIVYHWETRADKSKHAGAIAYCKTENGTIIGETFPQDIDISNAFNLRYKYSIWGDKCMIYYTPVLKKYSLPNIEKEWVMESILHNRVSQHHDSLLIKEVLSVKEYLTTGITNGNNNLITKSLNSKVIQFNELNYFNLNLLLYIKLNARYVKNSLLLNYPLKEIQNNAIRKKWYFFIPLTIGYLKYKNACKKLNKRKNINY